MSATTLLQHYQSLAALDPEGRALLERTQHISVAPGTQLFRQGDPCQHFIMVTSGTVKVFARNSAGREIVLYRIRDNGTCVLTTSCLLGQQCYPAEGIAETAVEAFLLPLKLFEQALSQSAGLRQFIFASYTTPLTEMIQLIQSVAFERMESRLVDFLLRHADSQQKIAASHQQIADELGTAREVVSRQLKKLEQQQLIRLERGCIHLLDLNQLHSVT